MTILSKALLVCLAVFCGLQAFLDCRSGILFASIDDISRDIAAGRVAPADLDRLPPRLQAVGPVDCRTGAARDVAIIGLYLADLTAIARGIDPLETTRDASVTAARDAAQRRIDAALACSPADGDLWMRSALLADLRGEPRQVVAQRLTLSERMAPAEGWIVARRTAWFPDGPAAAVRQP